MKPEPGSVAAFQAFMALAAKDVQEGGEIQPARVIFAKADGREQITWRQQAAAKFKRTA